ncbi:MAG: PAS domain S-box protein [Chitinophagaceae bacterium]|nr:MAG: PAS domain S-box protein [Chitinophagaceae bacterium]
MPSQKIQRPSKTEAENNLYRSAFLHSDQPKLIISSTGRIMSANLAACALLGYSRREFLSFTREELFGINEASFQSIGFLRDSPDQPMPTYATKRKDGLSISCYLKCVPFLDQKAARTIMAFSPAPAATELPPLQVAGIPKEKPLPGKTDPDPDELSVALKEADSLLAESYRLKKFTGKISYDLMWDWNLITDRVDVGESVLELFGYKLKGRTIAFKTFLRCLMPRERDRIKTKMDALLLTGKTAWNESCMVIRKDGSVAFTVSRAKILRNDQGQASHVVGATQDISRIHELEQQLKDQVEIQEELSQIFEVASSLSSDARWDWNLNTNEFFFGSGFQLLFGYDTNQKAVNTVLDWSTYLHPEDQEDVKNDLQLAIQSKTDYWEYAYRFIRADGTIAKVFNRASIIRNIRGKAIRMIGVMQDVSRQDVLEQELAQEIKLKDKKIEEAQQEAKEAERSDIGKELHDNVNQLLGASRMYLDMARKGGKERDEMIARSSEFTMTAIEEIRKLTKGLTSDFINHIGLREAIRNLAKETMKASSIQITCRLASVDGEQLSSKFKINIFRIIQEQLTNILKHAEASLVLIGLKATAKEISLIITDDGVGFNPSLIRKGIGVDNILSRAKTFNGTAEFESTPGHGCMLKVRFPLPSID